MDDESMEIPVKVFLPSGDIELGMLSFQKDGPIVVINNRTYIQSNNQGITYSIRRKEDLRFFSGLTTEDQITLQSKITSRTINLSSEGQYDLYPPSSSKWVSLLSDTGKSAIFFVQDIISNSKKLLTIFDFYEEDIVRSQLVNQYETEILFMMTDWNVYNSIRNRGIDESFISKLLDSPPPTWKKLAIILDGISIPKLELFESMEKTMDQFVPASFPEATRRELKAFLSWIQEEKIPEEDPLDFSSKTANAPVFSSLAFGHIQCLLENKTPPQYVRIMTMAERGLLDLPMLPTEETIEQNSWELAWYKIIELLPNRRKRVIEIADQLNKDQTILTDLPVTREMAKASKGAWIERFALINYTLHMRGYIQTQRIGLDTVVYVGGAHKWPHNHLAWTARLGNPTEKPPFIQVMVMPKNSSEQANRSLPNLSKIAWSTSCFNLSLFDSSKQKWKSTIARITNSLGGKRTLKQLEKEFPPSSKGSILMPSEIESRVLDYASWQMYLSSLEKGVYESHLGINNLELYRILSDLKEKGILKIQYLLRIPGLVATCQIIEGEPNKILALVRAFLKHQPSTTAMIENGSKKAYIISRVPEDEVYEILVNLPNEAAKNGIDIRSYRIDAYVGYQHNLYSRLLKSDGTWDDDISGLLNQSSQSRF